MIHDLWISNAGVTSCTTVDGTSDYSRRLRQCQSEAWFPGRDACAGGRHPQLIVGRLKAAPTTVRVAERGSERSIVWLYTADT